MSSELNIGLIGFGEVGSTLSRELAAQSVGLRAFDLRFADNDSAPSRAARRQASVQVCTSPAELAPPCQLIFSAVTAAQSLAAAQSVAHSISSATWYVDLNSVSPETRLQAAACIESAGGRYVECAVMSPIQPNGVASPMLVGGPHASAFLGLAQSLGFSGSSVYSQSLGAASAAKLCRSVMVKGIEALVTESMLAARFYGVEATVLDSLGAMFPGVDWRSHAAYLIERTRTHGARRAEEMDEAAATVRAAAVPPLMSEACARRQALSAEPDSGAGSVDELLAHIAR